jgi:hypothetical protein
MCYLWQKEYKPSPIIPVGIEQSEQHLALIDTGASATLVSFSWFHSVSKAWTEKEFEMRRNTISPRVFGISGAELTVVGKFYVVIKLGQGLYPHEAVVIKAPGEEYNPTGHKIDMIIGVDFMGNHQVFLGFGIPDRQGRYDYVYIDNQMFKITDSFDVVTYKFMGGLKMPVLSIHEKESDTLRCSICTVQEDTTVDSKQLRWLTLKDELNEKDRYLPNQMIAPGVVLLQCWWTANCKPLHFRL